jgi:cell division protein FtsB
MTGASARAVAPSRLRLSPRATILALILAGLLLYAVGPLRTYLAQRDRLAQLEQQTQVLEQENVRLEREIERLNDPQYLERLARERLGMAKPGEIGFVVVPEQPPAGG